MMKKIILMVGLFLISINAIFSQTLKPLANDSLSVSDSLNQFAFDSYQKINNPDQNTVFSPYSVSSLLGFLTAASDGNTQQQFINLLHLNKSYVDKIAKNISQLNLDLYNNNKSSLQIANGFFAAKNFTYKASFLDLFKDVRFINFNVFDFKNNAEGAREAINQFVSDKTNGYIQNLFPSGSISASDLLVLVNAIYFKGLWKTPFDANHTQLRPFYLNNNDKIDAETMYKQSDYLYFENADFQLVALPYENSTLLLYVLLPKEKDKLNTIESQLTATMFNQIQQKIQIENSLNVYLPKFKIQSFFNDLDQAIKQMGLTDAFLLDKADFSNLTDAKFIISKIIQQAIIEVDEKGTTAAAATGIVGVAGAPSGGRPTKTFDANHPFLFILFDSYTHTILFMGHVVNPQQ